MIVTSVDVYKEALLYSVSLLRVRLLFLSVCVCVCPVSDLFVLLVLFRFVFVSKKEKINSLLNCRDHKEKYLSLIHI